MNFRRVLALQSANAALVYVPRGDHAKCLLTKKRAKVLLFFDIRKYFCIFLLFYAIFQQNKPINTPVRAVPRSE